MQIYLSFHDHNILISGLEEAIVEKLRAEFQYFLRPELSYVHTTIELLKEQLPGIPPLLAVKVLENCAVYELGSRQYIDYFGSALTIWDHQEETIKIYSLEDDRLFELGFLALQSVIGQRLSKSGLNRVHALGVSLGETNAVVMLPSKGGKSTLLRHLLENPEVKVISDDTPIVDVHGRVYPFPTKISLDRPPKDGVLSGLKWEEFRRTTYPPKWTASLAALDRKIEHQSYQHKTLLIAGFRLSQGQSLLTPVPKWKLLRPLLEHMVLGFGLPQILEMFLRFRFADVFKLAFHGASRCLSAGALLARSSTYHFYLGPDAAYNAQLLLHELYDAEAPR